MKSIIKRFRTLLCLNSIPISAWMWIGLALVPVRGQDRVEPPPVDLRVGDVLNINFGVGQKVGLAAFGKSDTDFWNLMGQAYNPDYSVSDLRRSDGERTAIAARLQNSGGIWGNRSGDTMYDSYCYPNSTLGDGVGNLLLTITGLAPGTYDLVLYGHADHITPDNRPESDTVFSARVAGRRYGPIGTLASPLWTVDQGWQEGLHYIVLRDVQVSNPSESIAITGEPGYNGIAGTLGNWDRVAVINGLQLIRVGAGSDADQDGVLDELDACPNTLPGSIVDASGCSLEQHCPCDENRRNRGDYVVCIVTQAREFFEAGRINAEQRRGWIRDSVRSNCGR